MRKMVITLLALGVFAASTAFAGNLLNESFTYTDGPLAGLNPGLPAAGPWAIYNGAVDIKVVGGVAVGGSPAITYGDADDHVPFAIRTLLEPTYACFDVIIPAISGAPKLIYFAGFNTTANTSLMMARVFVASFSGGGWTFAISNTSNNASWGVTSWPSALAFDTRYTLVIKYDPTTHTSTLWVNPATETSPSVSNVRGDLGAVQVNTFFLRQSASQGTFPPGSPTGTVDWSWRVDNVGVGTSFAEACYTVPVPVNGSTWGQLKSLYR
jgi:hypothetical protein